ncbi:MAG: arcadin 1 [Candidatus Nezhaarchaeota archaeon]|nr:arcadin 1 [Candidatus Nezhaarchaeota archaeon]MCX8142528.1 arcadin 1 [Candidatus Nezhaarchaeota archaeon]MDW8050499.1 arcadin 1 [Nitrososphaerota archaeon]
MEIKFKAVVISKSIYGDPMGGKGVKIELAEERELPPPIFMSRGEGSEIMKEVMPLVSQIVQALPFTRGGKVTVPRLMLWLSEDEWDKLEPKPDIGDEVEVVVSSGRVTISSSR